MLNQATRAFVADTLDTGIVDHLLAGDIARSDDDIKHGRVTSHEDVLTDLDERLATASAVSREMEHVHQITDRWQIAWHVGIVVIRHRVREIVAAADRQRLKAPIALDELEDRDVIVIGVHHASAPRMRGDCQQGHARPITEKIHWLDEARVVKATTLIKGDEDGRFGKHVRSCLDPLDDVLHEGFEQVKLGR